MIGQRQSESFEAKPCSYTYNSLAGPENIRLFVLEPSTCSDAPLCLSFREGHLRELEGQYEAISYTWGGPILTCSLQLPDNSCIWITRNLDLALRRFRRSNRDRSLWADAVCINQQDSQEKAFQIPLMTQVFSGARRVLVWLGSGGREEKGLHVLDRWSRHPLRRSSSGVTSKLIGNQPELDIETALITKDVGSITELLSLPWFGRMWVIQELVSNQESTLIYGPTELSWFRAWKAFKALRAYLGSHDSHPAMVSALGTGLVMADLWDESFGLGSTGDTPMGILDLLDSFAAQTCTDSRDRIYAIYSLANNITAKGDSDCNIVMPIDYSMNLQQTYECLAIACAKQNVHGSLRWGAQTILGAALMRQWSRVPHDWRTWVPDWRIAPRPVQRLPHLVFEEVLSDNSVIISLMCNWLNSPLFPPHPAESGSPGVTWEVLSKSNEAFKNNLRRLPPFAQPTYPTIDNVSTLQNCNGLFTLEAYQQACHTLQVPTDWSCFADGLVCLHTYLKYLVQGQLSFPDEKPASECMRRIRQTEDFHYNLEPITHALQAALADYRLFTAPAPIGPKKFFGIGNKHMQRNDVLISYLIYRKFCANKRQDEHSHEVYFALILRPVAPISDAASHTQCESFRLVGSACVLSPIVHYIPQWSAENGKNRSDRVYGSEMFYARIC